MENSTTPQDGKAMSPASAGSGAGEHPLFSVRFRMAHAAWEWCAENGASVSAPVNIVTALFSLGLVVKKPTLTDAEREAITTAMNAYGENNGDAECAQIEQTLWKLLERTK